MESDFTPFEKDVLKQAIAAEDKTVKVDKLDQQKSWDKISSRLGLKGNAGGGGAGGAGMGDVGVKGIGKKSKLDYKKGGKVSSASKRAADGCAIRGKTRA